MTNDICPTRPHIYKRNGVWECWSRTGLSFGSAAVIGVGECPSSAYDDWQKVRWRVEDGRIHQQLMAEQLKANKFWRTVTIDDDAISRLIDGMVFT
jgi:hypothetical protein